MLGPVATVGVCGLALPPDLWGCQVHVCPETQGLWPEAAGLQDPVPHARAVRTRAHVRQCAPPALFVEGPEMKTRDPEPATDGNSVSFVEWMVRNEFQTCPLLVSTHPGAF